jgi:hypothetical protein
MAVLPQTHYDIEIQGTDRTRVTFSFRRKGERADRRILAGPTMWQNERFVRQAAPLLERFNL